MSGAQHTPGPWKQSRNNPLRVVSAGKHRETANRLTPATVAVFERAEDAALASATLDLLTVAQLLVQANCPEAVAFATQRAHAAIAKATGITSALAAPAPTTSRCPHCGDWLGEHDRDCIKFGRGSA